MNSPKWMLLSSDLAKDGIRLMVRVCHLDVLEPLDIGLTKYRSNADKPMTTLMFTMFEPRTLPTEIGAPPDKAATSATVNSGKDVEKASKLKPTAVFPSRVLIDSLTALFIVKLLARFNTTIEIPIIKRSSKNCAKAHQPRFVFVNFFLTPNLIYVTRSQVGMRIMIDYTYIVFCF
ncbi:MAG: hypothetical protein QHH24_04325 [Candidatus Bathyarchaeota archaeon]|nr:hypothetical protein [Candidatus Bathyarchaeota archaeon]